MSNERYNLVASIGLCVSLALVVFIYWRSSVKSDKGYQSAIKAIPDLVAKLPTAPPVVE